jgi:glycosyltransferase involved in cell wall biosynthesis
VNARQQPHTPSGSEGNASEDSPRPAERDTPVAEAAAQTGTGGAGPRTAAGQNAAYSAVGGRTSAQAGGGETANGTGVEEADARTATVQNAAHTAMGETAPTAGLGHGARTGMGDAGTRATARESTGSGADLSLLVIPLGEAARGDVEGVVARRFGGVRLEWLDRVDLRRRPMRTLWRLMRVRYGAAVLVAPDLGQPRLKLTSMVLGLVRAEQRWRVDLVGGCEAFGLGSHLARNVVGIVRHLLAVVLALLVAEPALTLVAHFIRPRRVSPGRPSRVLYLRSQLWLGLAGGGSVAHTAGVIGGLGEAGVDVQVVSSDRLPGVTAPTQVVAPAMWFDGWLREAEDLAYNFAFFLAALQRARCTRPQVIYQRHTAFNCAGAVLSRLLRLPLVLEFNSSELWKGRYWGGLDLARAAALVEQINLAAADRVVVVSRVLYDQLVASGVPSEKILVNPNAVDPRIFHPDIDATWVRRRHRVEGKLVVGFSGTFGLWHGIPTLAEALQRVVDARPRVCWLLVGDGPLRRLVDDAIRQHALGESVILPGLVPHAEMPAYLSACDVLVSPHGRQADGGEFFGSPTKLFEYMAAGRPIVASAVGQIAEVLENDATALLVDPDDAEALSNAIVRLVDDAGLRTRLGQAARQVVVERHTWRMNAERLLASFDA